MLYSVTGIIEEKADRMVIVRTGAFSLRIATPSIRVSSLPMRGEEVSLFTYLHVREGGIDLYGFLDKMELSFFEALVSVSGIGPKSALGILSVASVDKLMAAVSRGESELLRQSSGVGRKTAERIVLELKDKVLAPDDEETVQIMQSDNDIVEALVNLGYPRGQAKEVISKIDAELTDAGERLRDALKKIKN